VISDFQHDVGEIFALVVYYAAILDPWKWDRQVVPKRR